MKKNYQTPECKYSETTLLTQLLGPTAPGEGIGSGGEGSDEDDPTAKQREADLRWGDLW